MRRRYHVVRGLAVVLAAGFAMVLAAGFAMVLAAGFAFVGAAFPVLLLAGGLFDPPVLVLDFAIRSPLVWLEQGLYGM